MHSGQFSDIVLKRKQWDIKIDTNVQWKLHFYEEFVQMKNN